LFAIPKPFHGHINIIQRNAIKSWTLLEPRPEIILLGDDEGTAEIAQEFGLKHIPNVERNEFGTPLLNSIFQLAEAHSVTDWLTYINSDVILLSDFVEAITPLKTGLANLNIGKFLLFSQRIELDVKEPLSFDHHDWQAKVKEDLSERGVRDYKSAVEMFFFSRGLFTDILPFALGRIAWDQWLVWKAKDQGAAIIDATESITLIHQTHDYSHVQGGWQEAWRGVEAQRNQSLGGNDYIDLAFNREAFTHVLTASGLLAGTSLPEYTRNDLLIMRRIRRGIDELNNGNYISALDYLDDALSRSGGHAPKTIYYARAVCLVNLQRLEEAEKSLIAECTAYPDNKEAENLLVQVKNGLRGIKTTKNAPDSLKTPVCFMIFNRPDTTQRVFDAIRQAKPRKLLVVADAQRLNKPGEAEKCAETRAIINQVDWDCEVLTNYADVNMGCKKRCSSGLKWVFNTVEEAIILEDDCLPHPSFFRFCEELLERYRDDERVAMISGDNFQLGNNQTENSYYFSRYPHLWGWAAWRRSFLRHYDVNMNLWPEIRDSQYLMHYLQDASAIQYWTSVFEQTYRGMIDTWDYQWTFAMWANNGLAILPGVNLISNIGFSPDATHTVNSDSWQSELPVEEMVFPLRHPVQIERHIAADSFSEKVCFSGTAFATPQAYSMILERLFHQGVAYLNANLNEEALNLLEKALVIQPNMPDLHYGKALVLARLGYTGEVIETLNELLISNPQHSPAKQLLEELQTPTNLSDQPVNQPTSVNQICKICGNESNYFDRATILRKHEINYFQCPNCGFIQTETPYWLEEAYLEPIANSDVGLVFRNLLFSKVAENVILTLFDHDAKFLDYGGGYGLFVRLMRDLGFNFYWYDKHCKNLFAQGFEIDENIGKNYELVTAFEIFEHFANPLDEIAKVLGFSTSILLSTELLPANNPHPNEWWYYALDEGQHISIYTHKTLSIIAERFNLNLYSNGTSLHLFTVKEVSPSLVENLLRPEPPRQRKKPLIGQDYSTAINRIRQEKKPSIEKIDNLKIVVDGVFFQFYHTGIARVWVSLLQEWITSGFAKHVLFLDRAGSAPKIPGIKYRTVPPYDYSKTDADRQMLQQVCDQEQADLLISTYYTTPLSTPSIFMVYDMIPEILGANLNEPMWREKHYGIQHASAYIAISERTSRDLLKCFPDISPELVTVAHSGVSGTFLPASREEIFQFKSKYGISKPYFLWVGGRGGYKNGILFFRAFSQFEQRDQFEIVCTGIPGLEEELKTYASGSAVHMLQLADDELRIAYSGAIALVYPSLYEGFGLPVIEAMACGCPVITTPNGAIPEVAGTAALYVHDNDITGLINGFYEVQKPVVRQALITAGLEQAKKFSWSKMADIISSVLIKVATNLKPQSSSPAISTRPEPTVEESLLDQPVSLHDLMGQPQEPLSGAELFIQSLGETAQPFIISMTSRNIQELLTVEQTIAVSSLWLTEGREKLFQYHQNYPNDSYLNLWTGLARQQHEQHAEAISNFLIAINQGRNHWRVAWYLAQSAEKIKDWTLAENALRAILQVEPNFEPAQEMGRRLTVNYEL
jgi:glycosyltransferase involved in cell wall biosynthesis/tetratricopeptide (TPR) repeat protein